MNFRTRLDALINNLSFLYALQNRRYSRILHHEEHGGNVRPFAQFSIISETFDYLSRGGNGSSHSLAPVSFA
ncbi:hypothetical protein BLA27_00340 [Brucella cytisi]|uniref:Uncharacterized protein n=1 Tax=Brucella cytisi TaxID=407152 RepID=A0A1J6HQK4_9HYPH|nr:hypothetical protein BLA27_00340 [Brucella cytisi]